MSEETALAIYRIAQESLHNAIQHADASEIAVRLTQYPDRLRMTITDDGQASPTFPIWSVSWPRDTLAWPACASGRP